MKQFLFLVAILSSHLLVAQNFRSEDISEAEAKAATGYFTSNRNMNTGNYDVTYARLDLTVNPEVAFITGTITTHFVAKENLNNITFELANNMTVSQVMQHGSAISFSQNSNDEVVINLPQVQNQGVLDSLSISYSGNPISSGFGSFEQTTHNGAPIIWTLSEPFGAKAWWPCKQDLIDKIEKLDVYVTAPRYNDTNEEYFAVSNGLELSQVVNGANKTTHFQHNYPIPAYLVAFAITNYSIYSHEVANNGQPFDVVNYIYPEDLAYAQARTPVTVDLINFYADHFGTYPFANEKYGHCEFGWGGGMEHTTVSFMGGLDRGLIAHELGHQWFGDKVTCGSWQDIWLNEGFATYLAGMVIQNFDGEAAFKNWKQGQTGSITSDSGGSVYIPAQDSTSVNRIFSSRLTYNKGSMVLNMLRKKVGDDVFFQGCRDYLNNPALAYGYAKTEDFKAAMENASGLDLNEFFNDWIYGQGYPNFTIRWNQPDDNHISIRVGQSQSNSSVSFYETAVPIRLIGTQGQVANIVLDNTQNNQQFLNDVPFTVQSVIFDANADLITGFNSVVLGTNDFDLINDVSIYPNPTTSVLHISKPDALQVDEIRIYNALGQQLMSSEFKEELDLSTFSKGILFLQITTENGVINKSIIKN